MISKLIEFLRDEDDNEQSFINLTRNIIFFVIAANLLLLIPVSGVLGGQSYNLLAIITISASLIIQGVALYLLLRGNVVLAKIVIPVTLIIAVTIIAVDTNGLKNSGVVGLPIILVISAILLKRRAFVVTTPLAILSAAIIAYADLAQLVNTRTLAGLDDAIILSILLLACAGIIQLLITRLNENIQRARKSERIQAQENRELTELRSSLEERVRQRTQQLASANNSIARRARQFEAVAQVANVVSNIRDLESLLPKITQVISQQFGHYHTGIFLLDEAREYAVLRAANSPGGMKMLARQHKLLVGQTGIVGYVTATGQPRIALDVGADAAFFDNPDLPNTHSEIALPLRVSGQIIGALDVQSEQENAFSNDDFAALSTLADQVSIAIQNTLTLEEARKALLEAQTAYGESIRESWKVMRPQSIGMGIQLSSSAIKPLEKPLEDDHVKKAMAQGKMEIPAEKAGNLAIPIQMRGQVIGVMSLKNNEQRDWTEDDIDIIKAVVERLSLSLETASLLRTTKHRADIERVTTDISSKISSSSRFETILQTAAQELSRALGGSDVLVQIEPVALKLGMSSE
jgi:GAF domain-containing protein